MGRWMDSKTPRILCCIFWGGWGVHGCQVCVCARARVCVCVCVCAVCARVYKRNRQPRRSMSSCVVSSRIIATYLTHGANGVSHAASIQYTIRWRMRYVDAHLTYWGHTVVFGVFVHICSKYFKCKKQHGFLIATHKCTIVAKAIDHEDSTRSAVLASVQQAAANQQVADRTRVEANAESEAVLRAETVCFVANLAVACQPGGGKERERARARESARAKESAREREREREREKKPGGIYVRAYGTHRPSHV